MESIKFLDIQYMLGTNHRLPLLHMAKSYIWIEEKDRIESKLQEEIRNRLLSKKNHSK